MKLSSSCSSSIIYVVAFLAAWGISSGVYGQIIYNLASPTGCSGTPFQMTGPANARLVKWYHNNSLVYTSPSKWETSSVLALPEIAEGTDPDQLGFPVSSFFRDKAGNFYFCDINNAKVQKWAPGATSGTTVAGSNGIGSAPDQLNYPRGIFVDDTGNVYVADAENARIQKWAPGANSGVTVAGGSFGPGAGQLTAPHAVFVDTAGNVYVLDNGNSRVQKWAPGSVAGTTVAGGNGVGNADDQLHASGGSITVDNEGNIYIADDDNHRVQKWAPGASSGITVAGGNGNGTAANQLSFPQTIAVDREGNVYVDRLAGIYLWTPGADTGILVAGTGDYGPDPDQIGHNTGLSMDDSGAIYVYSFTNAFNGDVINTVKKFAPAFSDYVPQSAGLYYATIKNFQGTTSTTNAINIGQSLTMTLHIEPSQAIIYPGTPVQLTAVSTNKGTSPSYEWKKNGVTIGTDSFVTENNPVSGDLYTVTLDGSASCTVNPTLVAAFTMQTAPVVSISGDPCAGVPASVTTDQHLSEVWWMREDNVVRKDYATWGAHTTIVAGGNGTGDAPNQLWVAGSMVTDPAGNLYILDNNYSNYRVQKWAPGADTGITVAGNHGNGSGPGELDQPQDIAIDAEGNIYIADQYNNRVQKWIPGADTGITVAGGNGPGSASNQLFLPAGVFVDKLGNLYIADQLNARIQKWAPGAAAGVTVAGGNGWGPSLDQLAGASLVRLDDSGYIYISEFVNNRIVKWVEGGNTGVIVAGGNGSGLAPNQLTNPQQFSIDAGGNVYTIDPNGNKIRRWPSGNSNSVQVAGGGFDADALGYALSLYVAPDGSLYAGDAMISAVRKFTPSDNFTYPVTTAGDYKVKATNFAGVSVESAEVPFPAMNVPSISIHTIPANGFDSGTLVTVIADTQFAGPNPIFAWTKNGTPVGTNTFYYTDNDLHDGDVIACTLTSDYPCSFPATVVSEPIKIKVNPKGYLMYDGICLGAHLSFIPSSMFSQVDWQRDGNLIHTSYNIWDSAGIIAAKEVDVDTSIGFQPPSYGICVDRAGNIYVSDVVNSWVKKWASGADTGIIVAGGNGYGNAANQLSEPTALFLDEAGNLYVSDNGNQRIQKWVPGADTGITVVDLAPIGFTASYGLFVDPAHNIYVSDIGNSLVTKWAPGAAIGEIVAGTETNSGSGDNELSFPAGIYVDESGNVYVADVMNSRIQKWAPGAFSGTTVAGGNGPGNDSNQVGAPFSVYVDGKGNVYATDGLDNSVVRWAKDDSMRTRLIGGSDTLVDFFTAAIPISTFDADGNLYVLNTSSQEVKKYTPLHTFNYTADTSGMYTAVATGFNGLVKQDSIRIDEPGLVTIDISTPNNLIHAGDNITFTAAATHQGGNPVYVWRVNGVDQANNNTLFSGDTFVEGDSISCDLVSSSSCISGPSVVSSNSIIIHTISFAGSNCVNDSLVITSGSPLSHVEWIRNDTVIQTVDKVWGQAGAPVVIPATGQFISYMHVDKSGNVYAADQNAGAILKFAPGADTGVVVLDNLVLDYSTGGKQVYIDDTGNVYISERYGNVVWKYAAGSNTGVIVAGGNGNSNGSNQLSFPSGMAVDNAGNLYIADEGNYRVQKWAPGATSGVTVAGQGGQGSGPDQLNGAKDIFVDTAGSLYVSDRDNARVMKYTPGATSGTVVAGGNGVGDADNQLHSAMGIYVDDEANVFVADWWNFRIMRWAPGASTGVKVAGDGYGTGLEHLLGPTLVELYNSEVYVLTTRNDYGANMVRKFTPSGRYRIEPVVPGVYKALVTTLAGDTLTTDPITVISRITPSLSITSDATSQIQLGTPVTFTAHAADAGPTPSYLWTKNNGINFSSTDSFYVDNTLQEGDVIGCYAVGSAPCGQVYSSLSNLITVHVVDAVTLSGNSCIGSTLTGNSTGGFFKSEWLKDGTVMQSDIYFQPVGIAEAGSGTDGSGPDELSSPHGIFVDPYSNVYVADRNNGRVQKWTPGASEGITVAGGNGVGSNDDQLNQPWDVYVDAGENVYIADRGNNRIQKWAPGATSGVTVAGGALSTGGAYSYIDPTGVIVDHNGALIINSQGSNCIFKWQQGDSSGTILAGMPGSPGNGPGDLNVPTGIFLDDSDNLYVSDFFNYRVQKFAPGSTTGVTVAGGNGQGAGLNQLNGQSSMYVDGSGNLYIADENNLRVVVWQPGATEGVVPVIGASPDYFNFFSPSDVAIDRLGSLYVSDPSNNKVLKFFARVSDQFVANDPGEYVFRTKDFHGNTIESNPLQVDVMHYASVSVTADLGTTIIPGQPETFTAIPNDAGSAPTYEWYRNGLNTGITGDTYTGNNFEDGDFITCKLTTSSACATNQHASASVIMHAAPVVALAGDSCQGSVLSVSADHNIAQVQWKKDNSVVQTSNAIWATSGTSVANSVDSLATQNWPTSMFVDKAGNVYLAEPANNRVQKYAPGDVNGVTVAGTGTAGSAANELDYPTSVFVDNAGNIYVGDGNNARVQKYSSDGTTITTVAGGNGVGSDPTQIGQYLYGLFVDSLDRVYVLDGQFDRVQKWATPAGPGVTVADGYGISTITGDKKGNLYLTDALNSQVLKITPNDPTPVKVAGGNGNGSGANQLSSPTYTYADDDGLLFIADGNNYRIQMWEQGAQEGITVAAGNGPGTADNQLAFALSVMQDSQRNMYVLDAENYRVQRYAMPDVHEFTATDGGSYTAEIITLAGVHKETDAITVLTKRQPSISISGDRNLVAGSPAVFTAVILNGGDNPVYQWKKNGSDVGGNTDTYTDNSPAEGDSYSCELVSNLFCIVPGTIASNTITVHFAPTVTISGGSCQGNTLTVTSDINPAVVVWQVDSADFQTITATWDAAGTSIAGGNGQGDASNQLNTPAGIARDDSGNIYVADFYNARVQKWAPGADTGITVAGGNGQGGAPNQLSTPSGVFVDHGGNVYVVDKSNARVQKWGPGATAGVTVAGGNGQGSGANQLLYPHAMGMDAAGNIYISDWFNHRVQKWAPGATTGVTVAGGTQGSGSWQLRYPLGIDVQPDGTIYIADESNHRIQKWTPGAGAGITVAGGNGQGSSDNQLSFPSDVTVDGGGNIYITDAANGRIQQWLPNAAVGFTIAGGSSSNPPNQFGNPQSLIVDNNGTLYVCDQPGHKVVKYNAGGNFDLITSIPGSHAGRIKGFNGGYAVTDTINVQPSVTPAVSIAASSNNICYGTSVTFTASATDDGATPSYQWKKNGMDVGVDADNYTDTALNNNDSIVCVLTSSLACATQGVSAPVAMAVSTPPSVPATDLTFSLITDSSARLRFIRGNGSGGVLVLARKDQPVMYGPECGVSYSAPSATSIDPDDLSLSPLFTARVIFKTKDVLPNPVILNFEHLEKGARYYFSVYEYDSSAAGIAYTPSLSGNVLTKSEVPAIEASNLVINNITSNSFHLQWTNGDGDGRIVVVKALTTVKGYPVDNKNYYANQYHGNGDSVGYNGLYTGAQYVVYAGAGSSVDVLNLGANKKYHVAVYEYKQFGTHINYASTALKGSATTRLGYLSLGNPGIAYEQSFDSFDTYIPEGWDVGADVLERNYGDNVTPGIYQYKDSSTNATFLGSIAGDVFGVTLKNVSAQPYSSILLQFAGSQWYSHSGFGDEDSVFVEYNTANSSINAPFGWTRVDNLTLTTLETDTSTTGLGTYYPGTSIRGVTVGSITGINLQPGEKITVRFRDYHKPSGDDAMAIGAFKIVPFTNTFTASANLPAGVMNDLNVADGTMTLNGDVFVKNALNIEKNARLALNDRRFSLRGELYGAGEFAGSSLSSLSFNGPHIDYYPNFDPANNTLYRLNIRNSAIVVLYSPLSMAASPKPGSVRIGSSIRTASLYAIGNLILKSDSLGTAGIGEVYGNIYGDVIVERWMQTDSSIRLLSHPFRIPVQPNQLGDDLPLDVSGSAAQNIWYYDVSQANPANINSLVADAVWTPYTSVNANWDPYRVVRLLKGRGEVTADIAGEVNKGNISIAVSGTANDSFAVIGNPYPSGLRLATALSAATGSGGNVHGSAVWTWDPTKGNAGAFTVIPASKFPQARVPICGAFVASVKPGTSATLDFTEQDKYTTTITRTFFRPDGEEDEEDVPVEEPAITLNEGLQINVEQDGKSFDESYFFFDQNAQPAKETLDAPKLNNPKLNFYSLSSGADKLSVDVRRFETGKTIPLGLVAPDRGAFSFTVGDFNLPSGTELYLVDKYRNTERLLDAMTSYKFIVDDNEQSKGDRFYLRMGKYAFGGDASVLRLEMMPNPAKEQVTIRVSAPEAGAGSISLYSVTGQLMKKIDMQSVENASITIPLNELASGVYMVEFLSNGHKITRQLVKQ